MNKLVAIQLTDSRELGVTVGKSTDIGRMVSLTCMRMELSSGYESNSALRTANSGIRMESSEMVLDFPAGKRLSTFWKAAIERGVGEKLVKVNFETLKCGELFTTALVLA